MTRTMIVRACNAVLLAAAAVIALCGCSRMSGSSASAEPVSTATQSAALATFEDYDTMTRALGFDMVQIAGGGYVPERYAVIEGRIGEIIYTRDDAELNLRAADGSGDIAGVNGVMYQSRDMDGTEVQIGSYRDIQVAQFETENRTYAMSATGMTTKAFEDMVGQIVRQLNAA